MSHFVPETIFDQSGYDLNDYSKDAFQHDSSFLLNNDPGTGEHQRFTHTSASPHVTTSRPLQSSMSTMSHSSVISGNSTSSSTMNSPFITMHPEVEVHFDDLKMPWTLGVEPGILQNDGFPPTFANGQLDEGDHFQLSEAHRSMSYVAPNVVQPFDFSLYPPNLSGSYNGILPALSTPMHPPSFPVISPDLNGVSTYESPVPSLNANLSNQALSAQSLMSRQPSVGSMESAFSKGSPQSMTTGFEDDGNERGRCPYPGCGRIFKDLRAHKLTHQSERPEKCPIEKCQYHVKGFARKYDQTRHTLTHYKGTMVCGFCPGSGSASEKSFNRADVFKRHLTSVHGVEQTPSNSRRKTPSITKKTPSKDENKQGKCSTCSAVFSSAQDLYNHLDDCVMKILEKPELSEAHNERHLLEVAEDQNVIATLERHSLPVEVKNEIQVSEDEDVEMDEDDDGASELKRSLSNHRSGRSTRGMTRSKGGIPTVAKGRRKRKDFPQSWGCVKDQMKMKKRVVCVFDGPRRLLKDEMMMDNEYEVRVPLPSGQYVTDLDVATLRRADAMHKATEDEKGPWQDEEVTKLLL